MTLDQALAAGQRVYIYMSPLGLRNCHFNFHRFKRIQNLQRQTFALRIFGIDQHLEKEPQRLCVTWLVRVRLFEILHDSDKAVLCVMQVGDSYVVACKNVLCKQLQLSNI